MRITERHVAVLMNTVGQQDLNSRCNELTLAIKDNILLPRPFGLGLPQEAVRIIEGRWYGPCQRNQQDRGHAWLEVSYLGQVVSFDPSYVQYLYEKWSWERSVEAVKRYCIPAFDVKDRFRDQLKQRGSENDP